LGLRLKTGEEFPLKSFERNSSGQKFQRIVKWSFERPHDSFERVWLCLFLSSF
ncbi:hypothetical protein GIB67_036457, partial [Kingdonia uniflora]